MNINQAGIDLIKQFEGFRAKPYQCSANVWTIGYGSTRDLDGTPITREHRAITETEAEIWLHDTLVSMAGELEPHITLGLNDNQFSALMSLAYNIGVTALSRSQTLKRLNEGDFDQMRTEWREWRKADGKVLQGLVKRREAELALFKLTPVNTSSNGKVALRVSAGESEQARSREQSERPRGGGTASHDPAVPAVSDNKRKPKCF